MRVTMLYSDTISKLIEKHGFTWAQVNAIEDNEGMVKFGENNEHSCSLEQMFYSTHIAGFDETTDNAQKLIAAFLKALLKCNEGKLK